MFYRDKSLGFSFELPEGWNHEEHNIILTFLGPKGFIGYKSEVIQIKFGPILPQYFDPVKREKFLSEPDAEVFRTEVGEETNVVILKKPDESEISAVHDGIHYIIAHSNDEITIKAIEQLKNSFKFPSIEQSNRAKIQPIDPQKRVL